MDAEEAIDRAIDFLEKKAGFYIHKLENVELKENVWIVKFDVGFLEVKIVELKIDDETGRLLEYVRPK